MIDKPFNDVSYADLVQLIDDRVHENKVIEYKRDAPDKLDQSKHRFLAAISSLANTEGGDLLYGIHAEDGLPVEICPLQNLGQDQLMLALENCARSGLEPRLPRLAMRFIPVPDGHVLLIRVEKSLSAPHRVKVNDSGPFYGRHSNGKFLMDVAELRAAFTQGEAVAARIQEWRDQQLSKIHAHHTPIPIQLGCKLVLHIVPRSAVFTGSEINLRLHADLLGLLHPMGRHQQQHVGITLQGVLNHTNINANGRCFAYTSVRRNGMVESVAVFEHNLHCRRVERDLYTSAELFLQLLEQAGVAGPFTIFISLVGAHGFEFVVPNSSGAGTDNTPSTMEFIVLPGAVVPDASAPLHGAMRPLFDRIWNAFGYSGSPYFKPSGEWISE